MSHIRKIGFFSLSLLLFTSLAEAGYGGCYGGGGMAKVSLLLVALGVGYWVLTLSNKQDKPLDLLGRITGGIIMLLAVCGLVCAAVFGYCKWKGGSSCGYKAGQGVGCPYSQSGHNTGAKEGKKGAL